MKNQKAAMQSLRHFIVEQALVLETAVHLQHPNGSLRRTVQTATVNRSFPPDSSPVASGEAPKDQRTGWNVLSDRNRAALNQNFAREYPWNTRFAQNYYERIAK